MKTRVGLSLALLVTALQPLVARAEAGPPSVTTDALTTIAGPLRFRFSEPVIAVTTSNVTVTLVGGGAVAGRLVCRGATATVVCETGPATIVEFLPSVPFVTGETYDARVNPEGVAPQVVDADEALPVPAYLRHLRTPTTQEEGSPGATFRWRRVRATGAGDDVYVAESRAGARAVHRFRGTSVTWITAYGPDHGIAKVTIDGRLVGTIDTYASSRLMRRAKRFGGLADRAHVLVITVTGRAGRGSSAWVAVDGFRVNDGPPVPETAASYRWPLVRADAASGDLYASTSTPGALVQFPFRGRAIDWITVLGPSQGKARVFIDGTLVRTYDNYAASVRYGARRTVTNLADGRHTIVIAVDSGRNRASRGTSIAIDRFVLRAATGDMRRLGAWVDRFDHDTQGRYCPAGRACMSTEAALDEMKARGVRTVYLQTGTYSTAAFAEEPAIIRWLDVAHARGIKVIGWYLPSYEDPVTVEVTKTAAIATFKTPSGNRFDGLGIDIEWRNARTPNENGTYRRLSNDEFFTGVTAHLRLVRSRVGVSFPIGAIPFAPLDMEPELGGNWGGFPWSSIGRFADVVLPMSYWTNRYGRCDDGDSRYCVTGYTRENIRRARALTGLPVHIIGGVTNVARLGTTETRAFVAAARAENAFGGSLYDASHTASSEWTELAGLNRL